MYTILARTLDRTSPDWPALEALNAKVLSSFGYLRGVSHLEYIKHAVDGQMYFLEAGARVGGAHVADLIEAATGINLWSEWADIEIDKGTVPYVLPPHRAEYGGSLGFQRVQPFTTPQWPEQVFPQQMHIDVVVDDLDEAEAEVHKLGATKHDHQPGKTFRVFLDPAGHPFCLCSS